MTSSRPTLSAMSAGYRAAKSGKVITENPYKTKPMQEAWVRGFEAADEKLKTKKERQQ